MGAFALQPHVAEFSHVVMHDETLDYRIEEVEVSPASPLAGRTLAEAGLAAQPAHC
jgi:voltage-gated potassium channel